MTYRPFLAVIVVAVAAACSQPGPSTQSPVAPSASGGTNAQTPRQAQLAKVAGWLKSSGKTHGSYFLPPYSKDANGNVIEAGMAGFATSFAVGSDIITCAFNATTAKRIFRVNAKEVAMDHVNGAAEASYTRYSSTWTVLEDYVGQGSMNLHVQGALQTIVELPEGGGFYTMLIVGDPTSSEIWTGAAKVGLAGGAANRDLKCGLRNDAKSTEGRMYTELK